MFVDRAEIYVRAGKGGDGCLSFRRERRVPRGGPDGGDGGNGGGVFAEADPEVETLLDFSGNHHWIAPNGRPGMGKNMSGPKGKDLVLKLPSGTLIYDRDTGVMLKDLSTPRERVCLAEPGKGGRGNARFARPTHQTPREFEEGTAGQERWLRLDLKLIADVGLVGLPNAGKSTLLSRVSKARPKIAAYPFTTLSPQLGIVELTDHRRLAMADIPGLIEGAHRGAGLGDAFLRHIERTRIILHLVDVGASSGLQCGTGLPSVERPAGSRSHTFPPVEAYHAIRAELAKYSPELAAKPELVAATKVDLTGAAEAACALGEAIGREVLPISSVSGKGLTSLTEQLWRALR